MRVPPASNSGALGLPFGNGKRDPGVSATFPQPVAVISQYSWLYQPSLGAPSATARVPSRFLFPPPARTAQWFLGRPKALGAPTVSSPKSLPTCFAIERHLANTRCHHTEEGSWSGRRGVQQVRRPRQPRGSLSFSQIELKSCLRTGPCQRRCFHSCPTRECCHRAQEKGIMKL